MSAFVWSCPSEMHFAAYITRGQSVVSILDSVHSCATHIHIKVRIRYFFLFIYHKAFRTTKSTFLYQGIDLAESVDDLAWSYWFQTDI